MHTSQFLVPVQLINPSEISELATLAVLLMIVIALLVSYLSQPKKTRESHEQEKGIDSIQGPRMLPVFGNVFNVETNMDKMDKFFIGVMKKFPGRARYRLFGHDFVVLYNAADIQKVLHSKQYLNKGPEYEIFKWIGTGALTADAHLWLKTRPVLDKGFRQTLLNHYRTVFCRKTNQLIDILNERISKSPEPFNIFPLIFDTGFDIISETAMSTPANCLGGVDDNLYSRTMDRAADFFHFLHFRPFFHRTAIGRFLWNLSPDGREEKQVMKKLNDFSEKVLQQRKVTFELEGIEDPKDARSLLDILLLEQKNNPKIWTDKQIRDEMDTFYTGGHGATTATFGMFLQIMATHPENQEKVYQEVSKLFDDDSKRELSMDDLSKLKYTEMCIKECLRIYPGVPIFPRDVQTPLTLADGAVLPVGSTILISPFMLHRDPIVFPDPEKFIPERFSGTSDRHPYSFIPFSAGPRNCIGKQFSMIEMKVYVAYIINQFRIIKAVNTEDMTILLRIFLKSKGGIIVKLEPRQRKMKDVLVA